MIGTRLRGALPVAGVLMTAATGALLFPSSAHAHGLIGRQDLPIPDWLFFWGMSVVLIVSFVGLTLGWRQPKLENAAWRPFGGSISAVLLSRGVELACGLIGVLLLALVVWTGLDGVAAPDRNFSITLVFVTAWLGFVGFSVLFGDVFRPFNPWLAIGRASSAGFARIAGRRAPAPFTYPERLGRWPAVVGLVGFVFLELVYGQTGFAASGIAPRDLAIATLVYSAYTFAAMALFGVEPWIDRGETFSQYFKMFASLSPLQVREGRLGRQLPLSASTGWAGPSGSLALVLVAIGATTFDGAQEGVLKDPINSLYTSFSDAGLSAIAALRLTNSLFLLIALVVVALIFWAGIHGMRIVGVGRSAPELGRIFAPAFIPIALAYLFAHYFSLFIFQEQAQFTYLLSDPFGNGSDLFGTAGSGIDYGLIGANAIWYVQFGSIVVGHVAALALGHDRALTTYGSSRDASTSQIWMLVVMILFSVLGLYLLSQANG